MPHLARIRKGWINENLARFILSRFTFVSHPATIADDIGSDFFCTIFQTHSENNYNYLIPKNSFAIQVKSGVGPIKTENKLEYLQALELPFFVGVCNHETQDLTFYSGEYLPLFFTEIKTPTQVSIKLCERDVNSTCYEKNKNGRYFVNFPRILTINSRIPDSDMKANVETLNEVCNLMSWNIHYKNNGECIFHEFNSERILISLDKHLVKRSLDKRLSKIFFELAWLKEKHPDVIDLDRLQAYQDLKKL